MGFTAQFDFKLDGGGRRALQLRSGFAALFDFKLGKGGRRGVIVGDVCPTARGLGLEVWKRWWLWTRFSLKL
jgi:hypothetical protein